MSDISWIGVVVGAFALFVLGAIWYTVLFGKAFRQELGVPEPTADDSPKPPPLATLGGQFAAGLVMSTALAWLIKQSTAWQGAKIGFAVGVIVAAALGQFYLFEGRTVRHLLINVGYILVGLTVVGAILGALRGA